MILGISVELGDSGNCQEYRDFGDSGDTGDSNETGNSWESDKAGAECD